MKCFSVLILSVFCSESYQHFCGEFSKNRKVIMFEGPEDDGAFIIGNNYWNIRFLEEEFPSNKLVLSLVANAPIGSDESLKSYSFPMKWWIRNKGFKFGLFNPKTKTIVEMSYSKEGFEEVSRHKVEDPMNLTANVTSTIIEYFSDTVLVSQNFSVESKVVSTFLAVRLELSTNGSVVVQRIRDSSRYYNRALNPYFTDGYEYVGSVFVFLIFSRDGNLSYCFRDYCSKGEPLETLINCDEYLRTAFEKHYSMLCSNSGRMSLLHISDCLQFLAKSPLNRRPNFDLINTEFLL